MVTEPSPGGLFAPREMAFKATQDVERREAAAVKVWGSDTAPGLTLSPAVRSGQTLPWSAPLCHQVYELWAK